MWDYLEEKYGERTGTQEVYSPERMVETDSTKEQKQEGLLEEILKPENLRKAAKQVRRNKGAGGVDGMRCEELVPWLENNLEELRQSLPEGKYRPKAVCRVEIQKDNGKTGNPGIPTVIDRMIQQAICQILSPIYEKQFSDFSFGFRPERSAHDALRVCQDYVMQGRRWAVDMDLEKFFDSVNQSKLVQVLSETIKDGRVISLIHKFLRAGIMVKGMFEKSEKGVPQGGPLSPLLGNIMLNECDKELEARGHCFARYADDMIIMCKSRSAARRTLESITKFIEKKLFLRVNREKSAIRHITEVKFPVHGFYVDKEGKGQIRVHPRSIQKLKAKLKKLTGRSNGMGIEKRRNLLNSLVRGWVNYFKLANMKGILRDMDGWLRRRIRMVTWKSWKRIRTRYKRLRQCGVPKDKAWQWANTRKGYRVSAGSYIMTVTLTNRRMKAAGYLTLSDCYANVH